MEPVIGPGDSERPAVLDRTALLAHAGGDAGLAAELVALFRQHLMPEAEALGGSTDPALVSATAHRLRGAALAIGAAELAKAALRIESGAASPGDPEWGRVLARLRAALG